MAEEEITLSSKVDRLTELIESGALKTKEPKPFRMPFRGRVNKPKLSRGYVTVVVIAENDAVNFTREPIIDGTVKLKDTYHSVDSDDCLTYKGKPLIIVPKKSTYPYNPNKVKNTTFGQKHIMSRMMNETLDKAKKIGIAGISIGVIVIAGVIGYALFTG